MFPVDPSFRYVAYLELAVITAILSVIAGVATSIILKLRARGSAVALDALLGMTVPVITMEAIWQLALRYIVVAKVVFPYDFVAAVALALALPVLHSVYRLKRLGRSVA